jgi:hypothetical protein
VICQEFGKTIVFSNQCVSAILGPCFEPRQDVRVVVPALNKPGKILLDKRSVWSITNIATERCCLAQDRVLQRGAALLGSWREMLRPTMMPASHRKDN